MTASPPQILSTGPAGAIEQGWLATWSLYKQGFGLPQLSLQRGESISAIAAQLAEAMLCGREVDANRLLEPHLIEAVGKLAEDGKDDLVAIRNRLPSPPSFGELRLALVAGKLKTEARQ